MTDVLKLKLVKLNKIYEFNRVITKRLTKYLFTYL